MVSEIVSYFKVRKINKFINGITSIHNKNQDRILCIKSIFTLS